MLPLAGGPAREPCHQEMIESMQYRESAQPLLLLIDMQQGVDQPVWGPRNNPGAEQVVAGLLARWRAAGWPIIHVRHDSLEPGSTYRPGQPGHAFKPEAQPLPGEVVVAKSTNSAFVGTDLAQRLAEAGNPPLVVAGVSTSNSVEATVRMGGNLGYRIWLVADACFTFDKTDWHGRLVPGEAVHALSLANMDGEYCRVINSRVLGGALKVGWQAG